MAHMEIILSLAAFYIVGQALAYVIGKIEEKNKKQKSDKDRVQLKIYQDFLDNWIYDHSDSFEKVKGYPKDWKIRRQAVLLRDNFSCKKCGNDFGCFFVSSNDWYSEFFDYSEKPIRKVSAGFICKGAHVHHVNRISNGGTHNLENLILLCEDCHMTQDGHGALHRSVKVREYRRTYRGNNKLKFARKKHICDICEDDINIGDKYFGGYYKDRYSYKYAPSLMSKICIKCYGKYEDRYKARSEDA